ncbi:hypothetical protein [uncultured Shewanella sp.]|uniref:hypothetical protein n=1 Tax=uncultured Shewanella sp. TaxID=173975 RepID=UPI0026387CB6|nr:hypothetical protein [uncultured Shewanella sp.]
MKTSVKIILSSFVAIIVALLLLYYSPVHGSHHRPLEGLIYKACPLVAFAVGYLVYQVSSVLEKQ